MASTLVSEFSIHDFLRNESEKDLLRFSTAGSVDDGKSTLIGRLLYDTQSVYEDHVRSIEGKGTTAPGQLDFALLTDGLRAEREQGITIDVAYRYFSTARRKFIIADTPGHEQYTRNMATGASTADAAVVLIDARKGVLVQSRRHAYIASLLRVRHVIVAVNKMDLVGYDEEVFRTIEQDFGEVLDQIAEDTGTPVEAAYIPVSALAGDNVVHRSEAMKWYHGPSLLELLESLPPSRDAGTTPFRFPVQRVHRPDHTFRGFAGQIASGTVRPGDTVKALPSGKTAKVSRIVTWEGDLDEAQAPQSVTLVLDRELDISRGDLICTSAEPASLAHRVRASLVWMDGQPLELQRRYFVKHASHIAPAVVTSVDHKTDIATLGHQPAVSLEMNSIGVVTLHLLHPIAFDRYADNRSTGSFVLIDPHSNATVAAGMIREAVSTPEARGMLAEDDWGPVTAGERQARRGHCGAAIELTGPASLIDGIERSLFSVGAVTSRIEADGEEFLLHPNLLEAITSLETRSGILSIVARVFEGRNLTARVGNNQLIVDADDTVHAISAVHQLLHAAGVFIPAEGANL
ncbi:MAG TPA: sulfate adenylyltransferase subunit CysN [Terracidiphilus sp.]|nr:sulfate adenylyltransferase subunit CysN [Terracidiphilus sp.]